LLTLSGTGNYFTGVPFVNIKNSTSSTFPSFYACLVTPKLSRAITGTLLLDARVDMIKANELCGRGPVTTAQTYGKRRRSFKVRAHRDVLN
jgi:hypothetical protein